MESICTFLDQGGSRAIDDNLTGCNTDIEILHGCEATSTTPGALSDIGLSLYPNPASDKIHISGDMTARAVIQVFSIYGIPLLEFRSNDSRTLDLNSLTAGAYFLSVNQDGTIYTDRFVVTGE